MRNRIALKIFIATTMAIGVVIGSIGLSATSSRPNHPHWAFASYRTPGISPSVDSATVGQVIQTDLTFDTAVAASQFEAAVEANIQQAQVNAAAEAAAASHPQAPMVYSQPVNSGGWQAVAMCEEGGRNDYTYGYYGILPSSWNGYGGVSTAGQASQQTQLDWEYANVGSPPNESGGCHSY